MDERRYSPGASSTAAGAPCICTLLSFARSSGGHVPAFEHVLVDERPSGVDLAVEEDHVADPERPAGVLRERYGQAVRGHDDPPCPCPCPSPRRYSTPSRRE